MPFSIDSSAVVAALMGAATGAICSAVLTNAIRSWLERRAKVREARELLAEDAMALVSEHSSNLLELYVSHRPGKDEEEALRAEAVVRRSAGKLMQMQVRVWRLFPEWYATKAMTKLIGRVNVVYAYFRNANPLSNEEADTAMSWLHEQEQSLLVHLSDAASITMRQPAKVAFLGFHKKTRQRRRDVLKQDEDDPPPWECFVKFQFRDSEISRERIEQIESEHRKRLEKLRCNKHGHAAHARMVGTSDNFELQIESCCEEFQAAVKSALEGMGHVSQAAE